jgi:hypothetical protein
MGELTESFFPHATKTQRAEIKSKITITIKSKKPDRLHRASIQRDPPFPAARRLSQFTA